MSAPIKGGVPAFPVLDHSGRHLGMSTRTYIATHALGFILNDWPCRGITNEQLDAAAGVAVRAADALIKALEAQP